MRSIYYLPERMFYTDGHPFILEGGFGYVKMDTIATKIDMVAPHGTNKYIERDLKDDCLCIKSLMLHYKNSVV